MSNPLPVLAPASGRIIAPENVANPFFSNRLFGIGPVLEITSNHLLAPFDGFISEASSSGDFIRLASPQQLEVVLLLGNGDQFQRHPALQCQCRTGDHVVAGQPLLTLNQSLLRSGDAQQRRLSLFVQTHIKLQWPSFGNVSMLEPLIFEQDIEPK